MERPRINHEQPKRTVTGEIVYLDEMRRRNQPAPPYYSEEVSDLARQSYELMADLLQEQAKQPVIMEAYEQYDPPCSSEIASCIAVVDELLQLRDVTTWSCVSVATDMPAQELLQRVKQLPVGQILADDSRQLALDSDYYPKLDITKAASQLQAARVTAWGWDYEKYVFTNAPGEQYQYPQHVLVYPSDEKRVVRQLDIAFDYTAASGAHWTETVKMQIGTMGEMSLSTNIAAAAYCETGYDGHDGAELQQVSQPDIVAFTDLVAEAVGPEPETVWARRQRLEANQ